MATLSGISSTGTLNAPGVGSGLDVKTLVANLMAVEQQPLTNLATQEAKYQAKLPRRKHYREEPPGKDHTAHQARMMQDWRGETVLRMPRWHFETQGRLMPYVSRNAQRRSSRAPRPQGEL